jgi:hypothetical protein
MNCKFETTMLPDGRFRHVCRGVTRISSSSKFNRTCDCDFDPAACRHRGVMLRRQGCETCLGNWQINVSACPVHGECTTHTQLPGVACCKLCDNYEAADQGTGPPASANATLPRDR